MQRLNYYKLHYFARLGLRAEPPEHKDQWWLVCRQAGMRRGRHCNAIVLIALSFGFGLNTREPDLLLARTRGMADSSSRVTVGILGAAVSSARRAGRPRVTSPAIGTSLRWVALRRYPPLLPVASSTHTLIKLPATAILTSAEHRQQDVPRDQEV